MYIGSGTAFAGCEAAVMPYLDQANIACGAHAGDTELMRSTVALARDHGVSIGAQSTQVFVAKS